MTLLLPRGGRRGPSSLSLGGSGPERKGSLKRKKGGGPGSLQTAGTSKRGLLTFGGTDNPVSHNDLGSNKIWQYLCMLEQLEWQR